MQVHSLEKVHSVNFYYVDHLIHISHLRNIFIVLFMTENTHINNAKEIASDVLKAYDKLNAEIVQLKSNC